jgi:hypothetical protein
MQRFRKSTTFTRLSRFVLRVFRLLNSVTPQLESLSRKDCGLVRRWICRPANRNLLGVGCQDDASNSTARGMNVYGKAYIAMDLILFKRGRLICQFSETGLNVDLEISSEIDIHERFRTSGPARCRRCKGFRCRKMLMLRRKLERMLRGEFSNSRVPLSGMQNAIHTLVSEHRPPETSG